MYRSWNPSYASWWHAKDRCENPRNSAYENYGGRSIFMCSRWSNSYEAFLEDMGTRPDGLTLERIDNDGPYAPENCQWATRLTQGNNKRNNRWLQYDGMCKTHAEWCRVYKLGKYVDIGARLDAGWTIEEALEIVKRPYRNYNYQPIAEENMKRRLTYNGEDNSIRKWEAITGIPSATIRRRVDILIWTTGQALGFEKSPSELTQVMWTYDGITLNIAEWHHITGFSEELLRWRMKKGWPMAEVLGFAVHKNQRVAPPKFNGKAKELTYNGVTKKLTDWARDLGLESFTLRARLRKGWTLGEALGFDIRSPGKA